MNQNEKECFYAPYGLNFYTEAFKSSEIFKTENVRNLSNGFDKSTIRVTGCRRFKKTVFVPKDWTMINFMEKLQEAMVNKKDLIIVESERFPGLQEVTTQSKDGSLFKVYLVFKKQEASMSLFYPFIK